MSRWVRDERGQVAPLVAISLVGLLAVAGLVIDGGMMFSARRQVQSLADGAARAGAMAVDEPLLRSNGGTAIPLNPGEAKLAARDYLEAAAFDGLSEVVASPDAVTVRLSTDRRTVLMSLVGVRHFEAKASSTAGPRSGP